LLITGKELGIFVFAGKSDDDVEIGWTKKWNYYYGMNCYEKLGRSWFRIHVCCIHLESTRTTSCSWYVRIFPYYISLLVDTITEL